MQRCVSYNLYPECHLGMNSPIEGKTRVGLIISFHYWRRHSYSHHPNAVRLVLHPGLDFDIEVQIRFQNSGMVMNKIENGCNRDPCALKSEYTQVRESEP